MVLKYYDYLYLLLHRYGEIVNLNLVRDKVTGKSKGFCFLCYEDQRSTILAVDNLNSIKVRFCFSHISNWPVWLCYSMY